MSEIKRKKGVIANLESKLLAKVRVGAEISRVELAAALGLAPSTIGVYVDRLIREGFLLEGDRLGDRFGRPRIALRVNPSYGQFIGVDFEAERVHAAAVDFSQNPLGNASRSIRATDSSTQVIRKIEEVIAELHRKQRRKLLGIGLGVPGLVDPLRGIALRYEFIEGWRDIPLRDGLQRRFGVPVHLEHNIRSMALAELLFGEGRRTAHFVCLGIRSGIAAGLVLHGKLFHGARFTAGEVGRWPCPTGIIPARHDRSSAKPTAAWLPFEEQASVRAIAQEVERLIQNGGASLLSTATRPFGIEEIIQAAQQGDALTGNALRRAARTIGWVVAQLISLLNPEKIILAGPLTRWGTPLYQEVAETVRNLAMDPTGEPPQILNSSLGEYSGALGAAALAVQEWNLKRS